MIQTKLLLIEYDTVNNPEQDLLKLKTIRSVRNLLMKIDFISESVPLESVDKLKELLVSLKGDRLTNEESMIAEELIINKNNES